MITQQRSLSQSPRSPSGQPFLSVSVTDPAKMSNGVQAYISYKVITKTNLSEYEGPEKIVIRRYSDFIWLRDHLFEKYKGIFIPPLPEKSTVEANGYVCQESSARLLMNPKMRAVDEGGRTEIEIQNSGSIKTLCGPDKMGQGINLIVDLNSAHECNGSDADNLVVGPSRIAPLTAGLVPINICSPILHTAPMILSVGALDHPQPKQTEGLCVTSSPPKCSSFQRKDTRRKLRVGPSSFGKATLNLRKGAVFRSSAAAISLSMASKSSRGSFALSEPEATLALGKALGIDFGGKDEEVLSTLKQLEAIDLEKARARVGDAN